MKISLSLFLSSICIHCIVCEMMLPFPSTAMNMKISAMTVLHNHSPSAPSILRSESKMIFWINVKSNKTFAINDYIIQSINFSIWRKLTGLIMFSTWNFSVLLFPSNQIKIGTPIVQCSFSLWPYFLVSWATSGMLWLDGYFSVQSNAK